MVTRHVAHSILVSTTTPVGPNYRISAAGKYRHWLFWLLWSALLCAFWKPLKTLGALSLQDERYSYLIFIPIISGLLIYLDRQRIFAVLRFAPVLGGALAAAGFIIYANTEQSWYLEASHAGLWAPILCVVLTSAGLFVGLYGAETAKASLFPLCFLLLMVPAPVQILDTIVVALQRRSADVAYLLFKMLRVPVLRQDVIFSLPGIDIEVARECSGIRSSTALLITGMLAAQLFLRSAWHKLLLVLLIVPVAVFKNAVRIVTLSYLGVYVDRSFLLGSLHHRGGVIFALVGVATLLPALFLLRRLEDHALTRVRAGS